MKLTLIVSRVSEQEVALEIGSINYDIKSKSKEIS